MENLFEQIKNSREIAVLIYNLMKTEAKISIKHLAAIQKISSKIVDELKWECLKNIDSMDKAMKHYLKTMDVSF